MPKIYFKVDAAFEIEVVESIFPNAAAYCHALNEGSHDIGLNLYEKGNLYTPTGFYAGTKSLVDGDFIADALGNDLVAIKMCGVFYVEPKPFAVDLVLENKTNWVIEGNLKSTARGFKIWKYKDYYAGMVAKPVLRVKASKSLKDLAKGK